MLVRIKSVENSKPLRFPASILTIQMQGDTTAELTKEVEEWAIKNKRLIIDWERYRLTEVDEALRSMGHKK